MHDYSQTIKVQITEHISNMQYLVCHLIAQNKSYNAKEKTTTNSFLKNQLITTCYFINLFYVAIKASCFLDCILNRTREELYNCIIKVTTEYIFLPPLLYKYLTQNKQVLHFY